MTRKVVGFVVGIAFVLGAFLFAFAGARLVPAADMQDLAAAVSGFIVGGPIASTLVFAMTRFVGVAPVRERLVDVVVVAGASMFGGSTVLAVLALAARLQAPFLMFMGLPIGAVLVVLAARSRTTDPAQPPREN